MTEMIQLFLDQTPPQIKSIKENSEKKNWNKVRTQAHKVKPTFQYVGLMELRQKIEEIEELAEENQNTDDILGLINEVEEAFNEAIPLLKKRMDILSD